jgi:hypothetical protein
MLIVNLVLILTTFIPHLVYSSTPSCGLLLNSVPIQNILGTLASRPSLFRSSSSYISLSVGAETMDRGFTNYSSWYTYLGSLGVTSARIQCGWEKCDPKGTGEFQFDWLDTIISNMLQQGVVPWLQLSFGNSNYPEGGTAQVSSPLPNSTIALTAWDKWVFALITRYSSTSFIGEKIITEIWNEPNIQHISPIDYADFTIRTATIIKSIAPLAQVRFGVLAGYDKSYIKIVSERIVNKTQEMKHLPVSTHTSTLNLSLTSSSSSTMSSSSTSSLTMSSSSSPSLVDVLTYHPYDYNPDSSYTGIADMYSTLHSILPQVTLMQGENGAPSIGGGYGALTDYNWTECSQAKYFTRRLVRDASIGIPSSAFSIVDLCYESSNGQIDVNHKGLLLANCSNSTFPVLRPKESYLAVSHVTAVFDASSMSPLLYTNMSINATISCEGNGAKEIKTVFLGAWKSILDSNQFIFALWNSSSTPLSADEASTAICNITITINSLTNKNESENTTSTMDYLGIDLISGIAFNVTGVLTDTMTMTRMSYSDTSNVQIMTTTSSPSLFSSSSSTSTSSSSPTIITFSNLPLSDSPLILAPIEFPILLISPPSSSSILPSSKSVVSVVEALLESFQEQHNHTGDSHWERSAYFFGHTAARSLPLNPSTALIHQNYALSWGKSNNWSCNESLWAGDLGIAWTIDDLIAHDIIQDSTLEATSNVMDILLNTSPPLRYYWSWVDTLAFNLPEYISASYILNRPQYKTFAETQWNDIKNGIPGNKSTPGLWNQDFGLWFRDHTFVNKTSPNGKYIFWGRGNSWAAIALVQTLDLNLLPQNDSFRNELEETLKDMAAAYAPLQGVDGLWRSDLMDAETFPNPETTASAGALALLAYGVRSGLLNTDFFLPRIASAWAGLLNLSVTTDGTHARYCQPVGAAPAPAYIDDESDFCLGLLLFSAAQVYKLVATEEGKRNVNGIGNTNTYTNNKNVLSTTIDDSLSFTYNRSGAIDYAFRFYNTVNHDCNTPYTSCSPFSYWGEESCGFPSHGGDCADFVSQCLLAGNHTKLIKAPCRGYPCGVEEIGAEKLGACLAANYGWKSTCIKNTDSPPTTLIPGDVLVFHATSCTDEDAHATLIVHVNYPFIGVAAHSNDVFNKSITEYASEFEYYDFLQFGM